jgi:hypothetical protein
MSAQSDKGPFLHELEVEVEAELEQVESSAPTDDAVPPSEWLFDPTDIDREEASLRSLLGAVEALEGEHGQEPTAQ